MTKIKLEFFFPSFPIKDENELLTLNHPVTHPLKFADTVRSGSHIVLLYEDRKYAQEIQFRFLWRGLKRGELCICGTWEDPSIVKSAISEYYKDSEEENADWLQNEDLFRILDMRDTSEREEGESRSSMLRRVSNLMGNDTKARRIIFTFSNELTKPEQIELNTLVEADTQRAFLGEEVESLTFHRNSPCTLMCAYDISKITPQLHGNWLISLIKNHHASIFAPKSGDGIVLGMI